MAAILLKNITISDKRNDVLISEGLIRKIEPFGSCESWDIAGDLEVLDCSGKVAIPGFINMHTHAGMALMRGVGEDMVFSDWIDRIWKIEENIDSDFVYWSAKVACLEMIRTGTTTFNDQYWYFPAAHKAATELGIRPVLGYDILDRFNPEEASRQKGQCLELYEMAKEWNDDSIYAVAFHAVYTVSPEMIVWISDFARERGIKLHIHLSETRKEVEDCKTARNGMSPVEYLDSLGVLGPEVIAAHTLWLSPHDIEILAERGVHCVHNINSNTKLSSGYRFLYNEMRDAGINVCLGTDGCASSNNLDMLEAMKTSAIFQKAWRDDPKSMPLEELMDCATIHGARALDLNSGEIAVGKKADITIIDTDSTFFLSPAPFLANLIYSAHSDCVDSVICNGRFVMKSKIIPGEKETLTEARKMLGHIKF